MTARPPFLHLCLRLIAAALLIVVGVQAMAPWQMSAAPQHGSAFSASTSEVALADSRKAAPARLAALPQPLAMGRPVEVFAVPDAPAPRMGWTAGYEATGPPRLPPLLVQPGPRAPPA